MYSIVNEYETIPAFAHPSTYRFYFKKNIVGSMLYLHFQADLQTAVVIANDIKMEAQEDIEKYINENTELKQRNTTLAGEIIKLHDEVTRYGS